MSVKLITQLVCGTFVLRQKLITILWLAMKIPMVSEFYGFFMALVCQNFVGISLVNVS